MSTGEDIQDELDAESDNSEDDMLSDPIWKRVMRKCNTKLVEDMNTDGILDQFLKRKILQRTTVRDIRELPSTSDKNRKIIDAVIKRDKKGYEHFKTCLRETRQNQLADRLTQTENKLKQDQSDSSGEDELHKSMLEESYPKLVEKLEPKSVIDYFRKMKFLLVASLRNIEDIKNTSDQNRAIIDAVSTKGSQGYTVFIKCLKNTKQNELVDYLSGKEDRIKQSSTASNNYTTIGQNTFNSEPCVPKQRNKRQRIRDSNVNINTEGRFGTLEDGLRFVDGNIAYRPMEVLGYGCTAVVYAGRYGHINPRQVAVKRVACLTEQDAKETQTGIENIYRELRKIKTYDIPSKSTNIINLIGSFNVQNVVYFAFERAIGTLHAYVDDSLQIALSRSNVIQGIVDALKYTHQRNIIHRHLKPANIFIVYNSEMKPKAVIGDYGTAYDTTESLFALSRMRGSMGYIAPEVWKTMSDNLTFSLGSQCSKQSDIFSLALVSYFTLSLGKHPFGNRPIIAQSEIEKASLPSFEQISSHTNACAYIHMLRPMLNADPADRPRIEEVSEHPALMSAVKVIEFFVNKSDEFERLINEDPSHEDFLEDPTLIKGGNWFDLLPTELGKNIRTKRERKTKIRYLLREISITKSHHTDFPESARAELGTYPDGHAALWLGICPRLLMHVYAKLGPL